MATGPACGASEAQAQLPRALTVTLALSAHSRPAHLPPRPRPPGLRASAELAAGVPNGGGRSRGEEAAPAIVHALPGCRAGGRPRVLRGNPGWGERPRKPEFQQVRPGYRLFPGTLPQAARPLFLVFSTFPPPGRELPPLPLCYTKSLSGGEGAMQDFPLGWLSRPSCGAHVVPEAGPPGALAQAGEMNAGTESRERSSPSL